jgi:hypothetical protein
LETFNGRLGLGWLHLRAVTIGAFDWRWLIEKDRLAVHHFRFPVTFVTSNIRMASRKRKMRSRVVIKRGGNPALNVVTTGAPSFVVFRKLGSMDIHVAVLADLRRSFELNLAGARQGFVACPAGYGTMGPQ